MRSDEAEVYRYDDFSETEMMLSHKNYWTCNYSEYDLILLHYCDSSKRKMKMCVNKLLTLNPQLRFPSSRLPFELIRFFLANANKH